MNRIHLNCFIAPKGPNVHEESWTKAENLIPSADYNKARGKSGVYKYIV